MKGIVFTEFLEMVEQEFGDEVVDHIIESSDLESDGAYTAIGTYHHSEIVQLLMNLSDHVKADPQKLLKAFGRYIFDTFLKSYPVFFTSVDNAFDLLESIDNHIHVEVKKLYPDADLPKFETESSDGKMVMTYTSERKMSSLAEGLIEKTMEHYEEGEYQMTKEILSEDGAEVRFTIVKN